MIRRPRWARCIVVGVTVVAAAAWPVAARSAKPQPEPTPRTVQVQEGDSLWTLAREYGDPHQDVRSIIARMLHVNQADPGNLQPGETVVIPAECLPKPE